MIPSNLSGAEPRVKILERSEVLARQNIEFLKFFLILFLFKKKNISCFIPSRHIFSGASTPSSASPFFSTLRVSSASFRRAARRAGSSPLMRQAV